MFIQRVKNLEQRTNADRQVRLTDLMEECMLLVSMSTIMGRKSHTWNVTFQPVLKPHMVEGGERFLNLNPPTPTQ